MARNHRIEYLTVFSEVALLKGDILNEVGTIEQGYAQALASIDNLDGAAHATLLEAVKWNRQKGLVTAEVLTKLLEFIENAAEYYREVDATNSSLFPRDPSRHWF